jgi:hypothetical protein
MREEDGRYIHRPGRANLGPRRAPPTVVTAILLTLTRLIVQFMRRNL